MEITVEAAITKTLILGVDLIIQIEIRETNLLELSLEETEVVKVVEITAKAGLIISQKRGGRKSNSPTRKGRSGKTSTSEDLKMIVSLPRYEGGSIEDHLRELFRISENNIKVKMSEREYKTYICHHVAKGEKCPEMEKYGKCSYAHSCDEQSFLANGEVYQMMVKSEGVFPAFIKEVSDRISDISNYKLLHNFWCHWTGYIDKDTHKIKEEKGRCEWIPFGTFSNPEPNTFMSLLLPSNWGNKMYFDNFKGTLASRDLSSILIELVANEKERQDFMKESFSHELYKIILSFDNSKECKVFLNDILASLEEYSDEDKIRFFSTAASYISTLIIKKHVSSKSEDAANEVLTVRKNNPYSFDESKKWKQNYEDLKSQFDDIISDISNKGFNGTKRKVLVEKLKKIHEENISCFVDWNNGNNNIHLDFCIDDYLFSVLDKKKKISSKETLSFLIDYICNKIINRKELENSIKEFKESKNSLPKKKEFVSSSKMEMKIKAIRDANISKFKALVKRYRIMDPELFEFLSGAPLKIAEEEQRKSRICPKYRTYLTRKLLGDELTDIYCSNIKEKRDVDRFKCSCNGGINCKHGLHLDAFICKKVPVDYETFVGEADDVTESLRIDIPKTYNPYTNPKIESTEINKLFIEGRNLFSIEDYNQVRELLKSGSSEDKLVEDIKNKLDSKIRDAFKCYKIDLKYRFVNSVKNINSEQIRNEGKIEKSTFKRWNIIQNERFELLNMFNNLRHLEKTQV